MARGEAMKKSKFTEEQITYVLRQADAGTPVSDVCRSIGVSEATFYVWKKKYASMGVSELRRLRQLEDENVRNRPAAAYCRTVVMLLAVRCRSARAPLLISP